MDVSSVSGLFSNALSGLSSTGGASGAASASGSSDSPSEFQNILSDAIGQADQTDAANQASTVSLLTGDTNSLSDAMVAQEKAQIALELTVQIRNRAIDAYNEVMRMQV